MSLKRFSNISFMRQSCWNISGIFSSIEQHFSAEEQSEEWLCDKEEVCEYPPQRLRPALAWVFTKQLWPTCRRVTCKRACSGIFTFITNHSLHCNSGSPVFRNVVPSPISHNPFIHPTLKQLNGLCKLCIRILRKRVKRMFFYIC